MTGKSKVNASAKVTDAANELPRKAALLLSEGFEGNIMVNAYGVFIDHHKRRGELQAAREEIDKALALLESAPWPSEADYNEL